MVLGAFRSRRTCVSPFSKRPKTDHSVPPDRTQIALFKHLTETVLPSLAREHRWPIRLDHCFKRICLDHAFEDTWYNHCQRPAERHIAPEPLARAIACARKIAAEGLPTLNRLNLASLTFRGKLRAL